MLDCPGMKSALKRLFFAMTVMSVMSSLAFAQTARYPQPPVPRDMSKVEVYLGTRDIGHPIYSKYGHTIVRVLDTDTGTDIGYNWGTFDFDAPGFVPNFLRGILIYYMSFGPWNDEVEISHMERQTTWMERVNLTDLQKKRLIDRLMWQARPENVNYPYLFFYDNCSTRVRDLFDLAVGGQIKTRTNSRMSGKTYRDRVMEHNESAPFFAMGQDVILNSEPDKKMTEWDDMFVPGKLRDYLLTMPAFDDQGVEISGQTFLSETKTLAKYPRPEASLINGYMMIWIYSGLPAFLGLLLLKTTRRHTQAARLVGLANITLGGLWGFIGIFLAASWAFGSHTVLPHNANLWLIWPVDALYMIVGFIMVLKGDWIAAESRLGMLLGVLTKAHLIGIIILCGLTWTGFLEQNTTRVVGWFAPLTALVWSSSSFKKFFLPTKS
jgi:hypothetical protein